MAYDPLEYVRNYYRVPAKKGKIVSYNGKLGVITGASGPHVKVKFKGEKHTWSYHPSDLNYDI
jgi:hypothetical protein